MSQLLTVYNSLTKYPFKNDHTIALTRIRKKTLVFRVYNWFTKINPNLVFYICPDTKTYVVDLPVLSPVTL